MEFKKELDQESACYELWDADMEYQRVLERARGAELYADHLIKNEFVLGPELPVRISDVSKATLKTCKREPDLGYSNSLVPKLRDCYVRLNRISTNKIIVGQCNDIQDTIHRHSQKDNQSKKQANQSSGLKNSSYMCDTCNTMFSDKMNLQRHAKTHVDDNTSKTCSNCNLQFSTRTALMKHVCRHLGETTSQISKKSFVSTKSLDSHKLIHAGKMPFICNICEQCFSCINNLAVHMKRHFGRHSCDICSKKFSSKPYLLAHKKRHGEKWLRCEVCNRDFSDKSNFNKHKYTHSKEKPFSCDICKKQFIRRANLRNHQHIHKGEEFKCEVCEKGFKYKHTLLYHLKTHSRTNIKPHKCEVCGDRFTIKSLLKRHDLIHAGEKPFSCIICKKSFRHKSTLTSHLRLHTGEKPYSCDTCEKRFTTSSNCNAHRRRAHK